MAGPILRMPQPAEMFAADLLRRGVQYMEAFRRLTDDDENRWPHASFFLLAHALELFLKAALCATGTDKAGAVKLGHKVDRLYEACQQRALPLVEDLGHLVAHVALMNSDFDFRYPTP